MESFNDLYDIERSTSEKNVAFIENSIHSSLLYNSEEVSRGTWYYRFFIKALIGVIIAVGVACIVIVIVLLSMKKLQ